MRDLRWRSSGTIALIWRHPRRTIRKRRTVTGTRLSVTAARKVSAVGAMRPLGPLLADHPARSNRATSGWWRRGKACLRGNDADEKDQHRHDRGSAAEMTWIPRVSYRSKAHRLKSARRSNKGGIWTLILVNTSDDIKNAYSPMRSAGWELLRR
jgi:hypothetical protein